MEAEPYLDLINEAERCNRKFKSRLGKFDTEHMVKVFTRLMLRGKIKEACRFITERNGGGVLDPMAEVAKPVGKTVLEVLKL